MKKFTIKNYLFLTISLLSLVFAIKTLTSYKQPVNTLRVGMMDGWAPFMIVNAQGNFEGFDVDVAQELAQKFSRKLEIINYGSLAPLFIALEQNKIDMILSDLDITQKRLQELAMVPYTGETVKTWCLVFWNTIPKNITSLQDLEKMKNAIICVEAGSSQEKYLDQFTIEKKNLGSVSDMMMDIKFGKSLAILLEPTIAKRFQQQTPELKILDIPLPEQFQVFGCGIALKKTNTNLTIQVKKAIDELKQNGTLKILEKKWNVGA